MDADVNEWGRRPASWSWFYYDDEEPKTWSASEDIWVHGYWSWDWANSYERVAAGLQITRLSMRLPTATSPSKGQRFCFLNIIEELTEPGEYYIDRQTNQLYCIPPVQGAEMEAILSLLDEPLLTVKDSADITFCNLQVEAACGSGILVEDCTGVTIDNCHIRNIGNHGVILLREKQSGPKLDSP
ncbi:MAG: right-handed parallel beta-helix repeat-containing protein [Bianqueaceae bacterium]